MSIEIPFATADNLKRVVDQIALGKPVDREAAKQALANLTRDREELRKKIGTINVAVDFVHDARNQ